MELRELLVAENMEMLGGELSAFSPKPCPGISLTWLFLSLFFYTKTVIYRVNCFPQFREWL